MQRQHAHQIRPRLDMSGVPPAGAEGAGAGGPGAGAGDPGAGALHSRPGAP